MGAIIYGLRQFRAYIYGGEVVVHTDHQALTYAVKNQKVQPIIARWVMELQAYDVTVEYISGERNKVADALSRIENPEKADEENFLDEEIDFPRCLSCQKGSSTRDKSIAEYQGEDKTLSRVIALLTEQVAELSERDKNKEEIIWLMENCYVSEEGALKKHWEEGEKCERVVVPAALRKSILEIAHSNIHSGGHMSGQKTYRKAANKYVWFNMPRDILKWVSECITCQLRRKLRSPGAKYPMCAVEYHCVMEKVGIDLCGPFPLTMAGNIYLVNMVDLFSKYVVSVAITDAKAETAAKFIVEKLILVHGTPREIVTDNASNFTAQLVKEVRQLLKLDHRHSTPYHSEGNGAVERSFETFQDMLAKYLKELEKENLEFDEIVPAVTFCYNTSVHTATGESPFYLMYGRVPVFSSEAILSEKRGVYAKYLEPRDYRTNLVRHMQIAWEAARSSTDKYRESMEARTNEKRHKPGLAVGDLVLFRREKVKGVSAKFHIPWKGLYVITEVDMPHAVIEECTNAKVEKRRVHINQIKPFVHEGGPLCVNREGEVPHVASPQQSEESRQVGKYVLRGQPRNQYGL
jgi:transposase InsO family protein